MKRKTLFITLVILFSFIDISFSQPVDCDIFNSYSYNFNDCNLDGFTHNGGGDFNVDPSSYCGCGIELGQWDNVIRTNQVYSYGTYEVYCKPGTSFSNQYFNVLNEDGTWVGDGIGGDICVNGTDDEGWSLWVGGVKVDEGSSVPVSYPNWYTVTIRITPDSLKYWIDDNLMFETDNYGTLPRTSGTILIGTYMTSQYDNINFTPYTSPQVPISNWSILLGVILILGFIIISHFYRKRIFN